VAATAAVSPMARNNERRFIAGPLICKRVCRTLASRSRGRVTQAVKAVTACHEGPPVVRWSGPTSRCSPAPTEQAPATAARVCVYRLAAWFLGGAARYLRFAWVKVTDFGRFADSACCFYATVKTLTRRNGGIEVSKKQSSRSQKKTSKQILITRPHFHYF
jgi:hypothetical protein